MSFGEPGAATKLVLNEKQSRRSSNAPRGGINFFDTATCTRRLE